MWTDYSDKESGGFIDNLNSLRTVKVKAFGSAEKNI